MGYASYNNITNNAVFGNGFGSSYSCNYYPYSDRYLCGITFNFEDHSNIINNIVNENHDGICLDNSFDNAMIDNTVNNNQRGIYIMDTQTYVNTTNTINSNIVCFNSLIEDTDIHNQGDSTTGNDNTCNTTYNYNDATQGVTPCTHACGVPICGDETLDAGEECDDGDLTNGDGCDSNCKNETCGNGVK